jgi:ABC-2 type transport system ATP-binding protein
MGALPWLHRRSPVTKEIVALDSVSLSVEPGEILCVAGGNGSGKTTLLNLLAARSSPTKGSVKICGHDIERERTTVRKLVGCVGWNGDDLNLRTSGLSNLMAVWRAKDVQKSDALVKVKEVVEAFDLAEVIDHPVCTYSAGMRRYLAIARSVLAAPPVLIIHNLFFGLDAASCARVRTSLARYAREEKGVVILSTSRVEEARGFADSVAILEAGRIQGKGPTSAMLPVPPQPRFTIRLFGSSEVVVSSLGNAAGGFDDGEGEATVTADVQVEGESEFMNFLRELLHHG